MRVPGKDQAQDDSGELSPRKKDVFRSPIIYLLAAALAGGGGGALLGRPDPFTGTQGRELEKGQAELEKRLGKVEATLATLVEKLRHAQEIDQHNELMRMILEVQKLQEQLRKQKAKE